MKHDQTAAKRYSKAKTLYSASKLSQLDEVTLRDIIKKIQGINLSSASNETMQQVFMSFVPSVFNKKSLDQYFTPITLIEAIVEIIGIGPNDKIADPAMGTADFLTAAMDFGLKNEQDDIGLRVFGVDADSNAYDLAVINMILNKDGQSNLILGDSIANSTLWSEEMSVVLCNPPFGAKSLESRNAILKNYDLGHQWIFNEKTNDWAKTLVVSPNQQLGILFIERCFKMLADYGKLAIILPEGYMCTNSYGYVRQWILSNLRVLSVTELPRRIFTKSDADLRSNILICQKLPQAELNRLKSENYPIHSALVRKIGYKMGTGFQSIPLKDPLTGLEVRDLENKVILDSDFLKVSESFKIFTKQTNWNKVGHKVDNSAWSGATINDIIKHPNFDMKPRRLMPKALENINSIKKSKHLKLSEIADVITDTLDISLTPTDLMRLVEGSDIRAVEGTVIPQYPCRSWEVVSRKKANMYKIQNRDIIIGLVRPERRNVGLVIDETDGIIGSPDGVAIIRIKPEHAKEYSQEWLFSVLRSEACRLQFWTESGGTSYGKLNISHINNVLLFIPDQTTIEKIGDEVKGWADSIQNAHTFWESIGNKEDRKPILNSAIIGLDSEDESD